MIVIFAPIFNNILIIFLLELENEKKFKNQRAFGVEPETSRFAVESSLIKNVNDTPYL